jgi:hypothetical protein
MTRTAWAKRTIQKARNRFPFATSATAYDAYQNGPYCVGGALLLNTFSWWQRLRAWYNKQRLCALFPGVPELAHTLRQYNDTLDHLKAYDFAELITFVNDSGNIDKAWQVAEEALAWTPLQFPSSAELKG